MTIVAFLSVSPVRKGSLSSAVANAVDALENYDVEYETNPMGTVIETDAMEELLAAVGAAHGAVDGDRVSTVLKIDDKRNADTSAMAKVDAVERELGRPAQSDHEDETI